MQNPFLIAAARKRARVRALGLPPAQATSRGDLVAAEARLAQKQADRAKRLADPNVPQHVRDCEPLSQDARDLRAIRRRLG